MDQILLYVSAVCALCLKHWEAKKNHKTKLTKQKITKQQQQQNLYDVFLALKCKKFAWKDPQTLDLHERQKLQEHKGIRL